MNKGTYSEGLPIANIVLGEIIDEVTGKSYLFDTARKAEAKAHLSKGKEDILRVKNRIISQNGTEDIVIGYEISLENTTFNMDLFSVINGGNITKSGGYEGPEIGVASKKHPFTLKLYSEEKDYDSSTIKYIEFIYKHCIGKPIDFKFEDGKFYIPSYKAISRPKRKERPVYINYIDKLPSTDIEDGEIQLEEVTKELTNKDVKVSISSNIRFVFNEPINKDELSNQTFIIKRKDNGDIVKGILTIDDTNKIVTFEPENIEKGVSYVAESKEISKLDQTGKTEAIKIEFTTIK